LVVTLEPCSLCVGAALQARVDRVVYGASSPKAGALGGLFDLNALPHNHRLEVRSGVLEAECAERLKRFFEGLRAASEADKGIAGELAEWSKAPDSKSGVPATVP